MVTVFRVQPFWRDGPRLEPSPPQDFTAKGQAWRAAQRVYERCAGVEIYELQGEPEFDYWAEPRLVARFGLAIAA
jgi:hypothetical protein